MKINSFLITIIFFNFNVFGFKYGEHQQIGNKALSLFYQSNIYLKNNIAESFLPFHFDQNSQTYVFTKLSAYFLPIGYGTVNALSGDHIENPLKLESQLLDLNSALLKIVSLNNEYINKGNTAAPDELLIKMDPNYGVLAVKSLAHFYYYKKDLYYHVNCFESENIEKILNPILIQNIFKKLDKTNSINFYLTLHTTAMYLAEIAGQKAKIDDEIEAKKYLYFSFLFNGFADHFLEDSFSGGHLLVNRSSFSSFTNNKNLHDFYCKHGTDVVNRNGEIWKAYGDDYYNVCQLSNDCKHLNCTVQTEESSRIVKAVYNSILDLNFAFENGYHSSSDFISITKRIPLELKSKTLFFINNYKALSSIPLPYNTNLDGIMTEELAKKADIQNTIELPFYRNYIKSRIANSIIIDGNTSFRKNVYYNSDLRLNFGALHYNYNINKNGGKKRVIDSWYSLSTSAQFGHYFDHKINEENFNFILKGGLRSDFDIWLTNKRFLGFYAYNDIGLQSRLRNYSFVYIPQIGIQLGSLLRIHYYNLPMLLRVPTQYLLPLKFHSGCIFSTSDKPILFYGVEVDFIF